ncbi:glycosyltransferase [Leptospira sp. 201903071]|uniref:glycosyltransferase n=1 Tax=Leptospira ainazelensis TaxID=2810034 RepID=UPI0019639D63|nr:glycosyltransferase [Leptospira ainazelensis]MBM9501974.1 glycosyltransferase [Leptospira ainazelensis]
MNTRLVSVIIPTYNRAIDLERAVTSVINQSYPHWEIIVVDNTSTDNTEQVIGSFQNSKIKFLKVNNEGIIARSRNLGLKNAKGEFVAFLDSDDWWKPLKLEFSIQSLNAGADIVYHDLYLVKSQSQKFHLKKAKTRKLTYPVFDDLLKNGNGLVNSSVVFRASLIREIGLLNEEKEFIAWEDYDFWLRIAKRKKVFRKIERTLGYYWIGGGNISTENRTLDILNSFVRNYGEYLNVKSLPWWIRYTRGKIYYNHKDYVRAIGEFSNLKPNIFEFWFKSTLLLILSKLFDKKSGSSKT